MFDGGQVGGRIQVSAVRFGHQKWGHIGLVSGLVDGDDHSTLAVGDDPGPDEALDHRANPVVHGGLAVPEVELDSQAGKVATVGRHGSVVQLLPESPIAGPALLQFERGDSGSFRLFQVLCTARRNQRVHGFEVVEGDVDHWILALIVRVEERKLRVAAGDLDDEHAHLRAPVTEVNVSQGVVTEVSGDALERIADDGGPEVPGMHLLGDVGAPVVHQYSQGPDFGHAVAGVVGYHLHLPGKKPVGQTYVDESGACQGQKCETIVCLHAIDDVLGNLPRKSSGRLRGRKRPIALELAQVGPLGDHDRPKRPVETGLLEGFTEDVTEIVEEGHVLPLLRLLAG